MLLERIKSISNRSLSYTSKSLNMSQNISYETTKRNLPQLKHTSYFSLNWKEEEKDHLKLLNRICEFPYMLPKHKKRYKSAKKEGHRSQPLHRNNIAQFYPKLLVLSKKNILAKRINSGGENYFIELHENQKDKNVVIQARKEKSNEVMESEISYKQLKNISPNCYQNRMHLMKRLTISKNRIAINMGSS